MARRLGGGEIVPLLKYDAKDGRFQRQDRECTNGRWGNRRPTARHFRAALDLANLEVGWIRFPKGAAPELYMVPAGEDIGELPGEGFKQGVRLIALLSGEKAARELLNRGHAVGRDRRTCTTPILEERDDHPGGVPIVQVAGQPPPPPMPAAGSPTGRVQDRPDGCRGRLVCRRPSHHCRRRQPNVAARSRH